MKSAETTTENGEQQNNNLANGESVASNDWEGVAAMAETDDSASWDNLGKETTPPSGVENAPDEAEALADLSEIEPKAIDYFKNEYLDTRERYPDATDEAFMTTATTSVGAHYHEYFPGFSFGSDPSDKRPEDIDWLNERCREAIFEVNNEQEALQYLKRDYAEAKKVRPDATEEEFLVNMASRTGAHYDFPGYSLLDTNQSEKKPYHVRWLDEICREAIFEVNNEQEALQYLKRDYAEAKNRFPNATEDDFLVSMTSRTGAHYDFPGYGILNANQYDRKTYHRAWLDKICRQAIDEVDREQQAATKSGEAVDNAASSADAKLANNSKSRGGLLKRIFGGKKS